MTLPLSQQQSNRAPPVSRRVWSCAWRCQPASLAASQRTLGLENDSSWKARGKMISKNKAVLNSTKLAGSFRSPGALAADSRALDTRTREAPGAAEAEGWPRSCPGPTRFNAARTISLPHSGQSTILGNANNPGSHCPADNLAYNNAAWRKTSLQERAREKDLVKIKCFHFRNPVDATWMIPAQVAPHHPHPPSAPGASARRPLITIIC